MRNVPLDQMRNSSIAQSLYLLGFVDGVQRKVPDVLVVDQDLESQYGAGYREGEKVIQDVKDKVENEDYSSRYPGRDL